jgi:hypothetical protein
MFSEVPIIKISRVIVGKLKLENKRTGGIKEKALGYYAESYTYSIDRIFLTACSLP